MSIMDIQDFFMQYGQMISTICAMVTLFYVIENSSKHDENIEEAFNVFVAYWSSVALQQQESFKQKEELFHQSIKPRYDVERKYFREYLSSGDEKFEITLTNKGLGNACNTVVGCMEIIGEVPDNKIVFTCMEPVEKNVIGVGEFIRFSFSCTSKILPNCINMVMPVTFEDLAGQKYIQRFDLFVHENGLIQLREFPNVEMVSKSYTSNNEMD